MLKKQNKTQVDHGSPALQVSHWKLVSRSDNSSVSSPLCASLSF